MAAWREWSSSYAWFTKLAKIEHIRFEVQSGTLTLGVK